MYKLSNDFINIKIKKLGAELCSLKKQNDSIEYIWQADEKHWARHSPILFPIVGKLIDNEYILNGKKFNLSQHGFARDMNFDVINEDESSLIFELKENKETLEKYPFYFSLKISYELIKNILKVSYEVKNNSKGKMPFSIGAHPAFNWPLENENKKDYYFKFENLNELKTYPLTLKGIILKEKTIYLDDKVLNINEELFKNDAIILENNKNLNLNSISLKNKTNNRCIKMTFEGFEYLGLWSKPSGADFICIEPWHGLADVINHNKDITQKKGIKILNPQEIFKSSYFIEI